MTVKLKVIKGAFNRSESSFRNGITKDGSAGSTGESGYAAASDQILLR